MGEPTRTRALIPGDRYREEILDVIDTGRRRTRWMAAVAQAGQKQVSNVEALVQVPGEAKEWWVAVERIEPDVYDTDAHAAWLRAAEDGRPVVERREPVAEDDNRRASRRAAQRRYIERQRAEQAVRHG